MFTSGELLHFSYFEDQKSVDIEPDREYGEPITSDVILEFDRLTREIRFIVNEKDLGVATKLPEDIDEFFGVVSMDDPWCSFELLE